MYRYSLERTSRKIKCPQCARKSYKRVVDQLTGQHLPYEVGRCDHESSCGYQYTWKEYLTEMKRISPADRAGSRRFFRRTPSAKYPFQGSPKAEYLDPELLRQTLRDHGQNSLTKFLFSLFPNDPDAVRQTLADYLIGTLDGFTSLPYISRSGKLCKAKLMKFDPLTGKRIKEGYSISSLEAKLKKAGNLNNNFETDKRVFFGEHLLMQRSNAVVSIVESEKTAVIASICKGAFTQDCVWLATGSKSWLKPEKIRRLGLLNKIVLWPDADGYKEWSAVGRDCRAFGMDVRVSNLIEEMTWDPGRDVRTDLADLLVNIQRRINHLNELIEFVNDDPELLAHFHNLRDERRSIMITEGGLSEEATEQYLSSAEFVNSTLSLLGISNI